MLVHSLNESKIREKGIYTNMKIIFFCHFNFFINFLYIFFVIAMSWWYETIPSNVPIQMRKLNIYLFINVFLNHMSPLNKLENSYRSERKFFLLLLQPLSKWIWQLSTMNMANMTTAATVPSRIVPSMVAVATTKTSLSPRVMVKERMKINEWNEYWGRRMNEKRKMKNWKMKNWKMNNFSSASCYSS